MENQYYTNVLGTGTGNSAAPFLQSLVGTGATIPAFHSYCNDSNPYCSAIHTALGGGSAPNYNMISSGTATITDCSCVDSSTATNIFDRMTGASLTWKGFCEDACGRKADHFPPLIYADTNSLICASSTSENCYEFTNPSASSYNVVSYTDFLAELNSGHAANYIWFTPTDAHNMHDNSVNTGDSYLQTLMVGTGTVSNPDASSVLGSSLYKAGHTMVYLWWDEYDPSPNLLLGSGITKGVSSANNYDEPASLHTILSNWGMSSLVATVDGVAPTLAFFGSVTPPASCTNGATNPPSCNVCPTGQSLVNGVCQSNMIGTGAFSPTSTGNSATAWFPNAHGTPSTSTITSAGVLQLYLSNTASSYTGSYNAVAILGCADYCGTPPPTQALPGPPATVSVNGVFNSLSLSSTAANDFKVEMSLYFLFATPQSGTTCGAFVTNRHWLDTELQFSYMSNGVYQPAVSSYLGCGGSDTLTYRETEFATQPGQSFSVTNFNITSYYQRALSLVGLPATTQATLWGIEPGIEGYGVNSLTATYQYAVLCTATQTFSNGACLNNPTPTACTNGATNPPACNTCSPGQTLVNGVCTSPTPNPTPQASIGIPLLIGGVVLVGGVVAFSPRRKSGTVSRGRA